MKEISLILSVILIFSVCASSLIDKTQKNIMASIDARKREHIIVLDAGHGGEDSGAVAADGTEEKNINLQITEKIAVYFDIFGIDYVLTRKDSEALGDSNLDTIKKRKTSDIRARFDIVNSFPDSYLLSIHQNKFPEEKFSGTQVFYSGSFEEAEAFAGCVQQSVVHRMQPENKRNIKASGDNIYLLHKAKRPSIMVECGFLSNYEELNNLKNEKYQAELAYCIVLGTISYFGTES